MTEPSYLERIKNNPDKAESYLNRRPGKHRKEMAMIEKAFAGLEGVKTTLDSPCGVGRATIWMAGQGYQATGVDIGEASLAAAKAQVAKLGVNATIERQDIFNMTFAERAFDAVLCFRVIHHFPEAALRAQLIRELCRVAGKYVVLSYISPYSVISIRRKLRNKFSGRPIKNYPSTREELDEAFASAGFQRHSRVWRLPFMHSLHVVVYRRAG